MFEQFQPGRKREMPEYTVVSVGLHAIIVGGLLALASLKVHQARKKEIDVAFVGPGKGKGQPPPPPPPAAKKRTPTPRHKLARLEVPKPILEPRVEPPRQEVPDVDEPEDDGVEGGVE